MGTGVKVNYSELEPLTAALDDIIEEFDRAGARRDALRDGVARPYGMSDLYDAADNFEGRWDDRRKRLMGNCQKVRDHAQTVIDGFQEFDSEASASFEEAS